MKITITQSSEIFKSLNVPTLGTPFVSDSSALWFPTKLMFNKTYYIYLNGRITAFRILAYAVVDHNTISYLVQLPNKTPEWIKDFITRRTPIFDSVEQFIEYQSDSRIHASIEWWRAQSSFRELTYASVIGLRGKVWIWINGTPCLVQDPWINYFLVCENGVFIHTCTKDKNNNKWYLSREECIKDNLNGLAIEDFSEEPVSIKINVLPNKPKIHILKFIEE